MKLKKTKGHWSYELFAHDSRLSNYYFCINLGL